MDDRMKCTNRKLLHEGTSLKFYVDTMEFEGGAVEEWDMVEHKFNAAAIIPILPNGNLLLVRQYRPAAGRFTWEIPAGKKEDRDLEASIECAKRELMEETGYSSEDIKKLYSIRPVVAYSTEVIDVFIAKDVKKTGVQNLDPGEFINVKEWDLKTLKEMILNGEIEDSKTIAAVFYLSSL